MTTHCSPPARPGWDGIPAPARRWFSRKIPGIEEVTAEGARGYGFHATPESRRCGWLPDCTCSWDALVAATEELAEQIAPV